ncbi:hypothetical protein [Nevskia sp.]|uniref:hypothetical protein n=1 Tax=Nevskia sp. TaxID=1929292 RepID=UPI0025ED2B6F|nr:hypothetical protein [Nevskia sp.]
MNDQTVSSSPTDSTPRLTGYGSAASSTASARAYADTANSASNSAWEAAYIESNEAALQRAKDRMQRAHDTARADILREFDRLLLKCALAFAVLAFVTLAAVFYFGD